MRWGFNSDKLHNTPKIMKYISRSSRIMLKKLDARAERDINRLSQSCLSFIEQRTVFEGILATFKVSRGDLLRRLASSPDPYPHFEKAQATSTLYRPASEQQRRMVLERYQLALEQYRVASKRYEAISRDRYLMVSVRCRAASEWYQAVPWERKVASKRRRHAAPDWWLCTAAVQRLHCESAAEQRYRTVLGEFQAASAEYEAAAAPLKGVFEYLRLTFEEIHEAFEVLQTDFEQLPSVRLNPPPIFLRMVGPISMDLRPFHQGKILEGKNVYSLGSMFLEVCLSSFMWYCSLTQYLESNVRLLDFMGPPFIRGARGRKNHAQRSSIPNCFHF